MFYVLLSCNGISVLNDFIEYFPPRTFIRNLVRNIFFTKIQPMVHPLEIHTVASGALINSYRASEFLTLCERPN